MAEDTPTDMWPDFDPDEWGPCEEVEEDDDTPLLVLFWRSGIAMAAVAAVVAFFYMLEQNKQRQSKSKERDEPEAPAHRIVRHTKTVYNFTSPVVAAAARFIFNRVFATAGAVDGGAVQQSDAATAYTDDGEKHQHKAAESSSSRPLHVAAPAKVRHAEPELPRAISATEQFLRHQEHMMRMSKHIEAETRQQQHAHQVHAVPQGPHAVLHKAETAATLQRAPVAVLQSGADERGAAAAAIERHVQAHGGRQEADETATGRRDQWNVQLEERQLQTAEPPAVIQHVIQSETQQEQASIVSQIMQYLPGRLRLRQLEEVHTTQVVVGVPDQPVRTSTQSTEVERRTQPAREEQILPKRDGDYCVMKPRRVLQPVESADGAGAELPEALRARHSTLDHVELHHVEVVEEGLCEEAVATAHDVAHYQDIVQQVAVAPETLVAGASAQSESKPKPAPPAPPPKPKVRSPAGEVEEPLIQQRHVIPEGLYCCRAHAASGGSCTVAEEQLTTQTTLHTILNRRPPVAEIEATVLVEAEEFILSPPVAATAKLHAVSAGKPPSMVPVAANGSAPGGGVDQHKAVGEAAHIEALHRYQQSVRRRQDIAAKQRSAKKLAKTSRQSSGDLSLMEVAGATTMQELLLKVASLDQLSDTMKKAGLSSTNLIFGIDYTASNKYQGEGSFDGRSLHTIAADTVNPYQQVIRIMGKTLAPFATSGFIPAFGFGDVYTSDWSVFPVQRESGEMCESFEALLEIYNELTPTVILSGPTNFAPLIYQAIEICQNVPTYHILVIVADGQVTNERATRRAIVDACAHPLSIIVVGVGDGPWHMMRVFDESLPKRPWDNFHFVEFHDIIRRAGPRRADLHFALHALLEVPDQFKVCKALGLIA